ncbi:MAG: CapA family protein [Bacillota bacterium]
MSRLNSLITLGIGALLLCCSYFIYLTVGTAAPAALVPSPPSLHFPLPAEGESEIYDPEGRAEGYAVSGNTAGMITPPPPREAVIMTAGDIMVHKPQYLQAYDPISKIYDFSPGFEYITPYLQASNLAVGNLETTFGGAARGYSSYPCFNSPDELAFALHRAGFDLLCTANNHAMDSGEQGVYRTLEVLEETGLKAFGTARSIAERDSPLLVEINGITLAFLAFSYCTNGIPLPRGREYIVNLIDKELMHVLIRQSRKAGADLVIVYMHWGLEYQTAPNAVQKELAHWLAAAGADIIIGSHPHVIQSMEYITAEDENGTLRRVFVAYSLGNFISNQQRVAGAVPTHEVEYGLLLRLHLKKESEGQAAYLQDVDYLLTWVDRARRHRIIPLPPVMDDLPEPPSIPERKWHEIRETALRLQERLAPFSPADFILAVEEPVPLSPAIF